MSARRPAGRFLWPPRKRLPSRDETDPKALDHHLIDHAEHVAAARLKCDEPEMVSGAILSTYGADALYFQSLRHAVAVEAGRSARLLLSAEDRLRDAQRRAKAQHVDASHELHVLGAMLERAKRGGRRPSPSAIARLERLEAVLDHAADL